MKKLKRILALVCVCCLCFSVACQNDTNGDNNGTNNGDVNNSGDIGNGDADNGDNNGNDNGGGNGNNNVGGDNNNESTKPLDYDVGKTYDGGTHIYNVSETSVDFIKNGATDYKIVMPALATKYEQTAVDELVYFFDQATNISLEVLTDSTAKYSTSATYISVGDTDYAKDAGVTAEYDLLKSSGFHIITKGQSVILLGAEGRGSLYAVYEFLSQYFNYEFYADTAIVIDKDVENLKWKEFDITDVPDFEYNLATYGFIRHKEVSTNRYRMVTDEDLMIPVGNEWYGYKMYHNSFGWLPKEYQTINGERELVHRKWYSSKEDGTLDGTQLCYTAHGDKTEYDAMMAASTEKAKELLSDPEFASLNVLTYTHEDNQIWCECETCQQYEDKYGSNAASLIMFLNELKGNIDDWFAGEGSAYKRDLLLLFFGYHQTNKPPTIYDDTTNTHTPVDSSVVCADGVGVYFAETNGDYTQSYYEKNNEVIADNMAGYGVITKDIFFWSYQVNFSRYLTPYNSFDAMQEIYQYAKMCNAVLLFDQGAYNDPGRTTGWTALKAYLSAKLTWDVNADFDQLIDNFFEGYFGPAAAEMRKMFDSFRVRSVYNETYNGYCGRRSIMLDALQTQFWPEALVNEWITCTENALAAIEPLKETDFDRYTSYSSNIRLERLSPLYILVELYSAKYSKELITEYKKTFYEDAQEMGIQKTGEKAFIRDLYTLWGV